MQNQNTNPNSEIDSNNVVQLVPQADAPSTKILSKLPQHTAYVCKFETYEEDGITRVDFSKEIPLEVASRKTYRMKNRESRLFENEPLDTGNENGFIISDEVEYTTPDFRPGEFFLRLHEFKNIIFKLQYIWSFTKSFFTKFYS